MGGECEFDTCFYQPWKIGKKHKAWSKMHWRCLKPATFHCLKDRYSHMQCQPWHKRLPWEAYEWQQHAPRHHQSNMLNCIPEGGWGKMKCKGPGVNFLIVLINNSSRKLLLFTFKIESFKTVADNNKMIQLHCISFVSYSCRTYTFVFSVWFEYLILALKSYWDFQDTGF